MSVLLIIAAVLTIGLGIIGASLFGVLLLAEIERDFRDRTLHRLAVSLRAEPIDEDW